MKKFLSKYLTAEDLEKISDTITGIEQKTSGEIRVCIKKRKGWLQRNVSPREIALKEFFKLKMNETRDKTGVLFFILFDEHLFEIIADEGINEKITEKEWNSISKEVSEEFLHEHYLEGILFCLNKIGNVLIKEFPPKEDDRNELSNEVVIG
jgi:uncharacterized membrane protein